jgi:hypothetical protein
MSNKTKIIFNKTKIILAKKLIAHFIFLFVFLFFFSTKAYAIDFLENVSFVGPTNNTVTPSETLNYSLKATGSILKAVPTEPNISYHLYFQAYCDGTPEAFNARYWIFAGKKQDFQKKPVERVWSEPSGCPIGTKIFRWTVDEVDSNAKRLKSYIDNSFTFKEDAYYVGFYYIFKTRSSVESKIFFNRSDRFETASLCLADKNTFLKNNPTNILYKDCQKYNSLPDLTTAEYADVYDVDAKVNVIENKSIYNMLAPIGGITRMDSSGTDPTCAADPQCITNDIGKYLNIIFKLAIGICAALAVIMLIINGVKYMGDESIFAKTEAKSGMFGAIVGLLIALGAWALLNTINPALTGQNGLNISSANVEIDETPILSDKGSVAPNKNSFNDCPVIGGSVHGGATRMVQTQYDDFRFCDFYAKKLQKMVADATIAGYKLSGGGYRSLQTQISLRNENCPDPKLTVPSSSCHPETALPGTSNHEQGLAVDLKCNGLLINLDNPNRPKNPSTKVCFDWLVKNAGTYGFKNLPSENWHWSIGPKAGQ